MDITSQEELYLAVGEVRADVRTLVERDRSNTARIHELETKVQHRTFAGMALATIMVFKDPDLSKWISIFRGIVG